VTTTLLDGPHPALPPPLDGLAEGWARLRPRVRAALVVLAVLAVAVAGEARVAAVERRWGGEPVAVLVADRDLAAGTRDPALRPAVLPPAAVPPGAVASVPDGAVLALALPRGVVLTAAHLDPRGPAAGLDPGLRAVPVPVEDGWAVAPGGFVDVWVLGGEDGTARQVAGSRAVLEVATAQDGDGRTALLALAEDEVAATTAGLALGRVLLTHAPAP